MQSAYLFVAAATHAGQAPQPVPPEMRERWLRLAARALVQAGGDSALGGVQLAMNLDEYSFAARALNKIGAHLPLGITTCSDAILSPLSRYSGFLAQRMLVSVF